MRRAVAGPGQVLLGTQIGPVRLRVPLPPDLKGRFLSVWWEGERVARACRYASGTEVTVGFWNPASERWDVLRRLRYDQIRGVHWRGRLWTLAQWGKSVV